MYKLGRRIFQRRRELGMTQNVLAERVGISREHLAKIETGIRHLSIELLFKIADELDTMVRDLFEF